MILARKIAAILLDAQRRQLQWRVSPLPSLRFYCQHCIALLNQPALSQVDINQIVVIVKVTHLNDILMQYETL
jgi:hypothetical protein